MTFRRFSPFAAALDRDGLCGGRAGQRADRRHASYVSADTDVQRIWDDEIRRILTPSSSDERLTMIYREMRAELERSPRMIDFYANPELHDPPPSVKLL